MMILDSLKEADFQMKIKFGQFWRRPESNLGEFHQQKVNVGQLGNYLEPQMKFDFESSIPKDQKVD